MVRKYRWFIVWMFALFLLMLWVVTPVVQAHDEEPLQICRAEDNLGEFEFPVANDLDLAFACMEFGGDLEMVDEMSGTDLVGWMLEIGFYNPFGLIEDDPGLLE